MLRHLDRDQLLPNITVLRALQLLVSTWNDMSKTTIVYCFQKANVPVNAHAIAKNDEDDPAKMLMPIERTLFGARRHDSRNPHGNRR